MTNKAFNQLNQNIVEVKILVNSMLQSQKEEILLDGEEVKALLKCSTSTLYRLRVSKCIYSIKIGNKHYYLKSFFTDTIIFQFQQTLDTSKRFDDL
jgi:hypothetical protein